MRERADPTLNEGGVNPPERRDAASAAIEQLVGRWVGIIRSAAARYHLAGSELDELLQDTRIRLWRMLEREGPSASVSPGYVYRAAVSAAIDLVRRSRVEHKKHNVSLELLPSELEDPGSASVAEEGEILARLERALQDVPATRRPAVRLHLSGRHLDEIAQIMAWSPAKARNLLYRGLADLRENLIRPDRNES